MDIQPTQTDIGADGFLRDEAVRRQSMPAWLSAGGKGHSERKVRRTGANLALVIHNSAWAEPHYLPMQKRSFRRMLLIFNGFFEANQRAWTYSWTQKPNVSLGSGGWTSLDAPCSSVIGATRQRTT
ncbi:hypothetical protein ACM7JH_17245 [Pseudomonas aeruginosa]|uniref:hypothetical protein n=1 Tax=Pseudomonas aeruginosa TaxID=287 RepID=UPI001865789F|nr:hypothetical protein [Pseudomonas aeruginosa]MDF5852617.1 hypothetical protein [Pseudomonas aeruginosa]HBO3550651.1 hypothetical protein [Pseudomonas aeruginosa]HDG9120045.1 hypothetical protein [Pseudomonas aeruginosa]HEK0818624.1 hypothetical protein [Pseudomonas aeruginosa]HEK3701759.1 hypothetical protein [Pseudomonas aeruginosa]